MFRKSMHPASVEKSRKQRKFVTGKHGEQGRFVTLKSGRAIFIPHGKKTRWDEVKGKILAEHVPLPEGAKRGGFGDPGAVVREEEIGSGITCPDLLEFADGSAGVYKDRGMVLETYGHPDAEVLAYEFSEALGWDHVPKTIHWQDGTLQEYVYKAWTWEEMLDKTSSGIMYESPRVYLQDAVLGNHDRHMGNILEDAYGQIWAIDNNGAFGFIKEGEQQYESAYHHGLDFLEEDLGWFLDADPERGVWAVRGYESAADDLRGFSRSVDFRTFSRKIEDQLGEDTRSQFEENVRLTLEYFESDAGWKEIVARADELEEEGYYY